MLIAANSTAQEIKTTLILGKVVDQQTHQPIPGVNIYTKEYGTVSDIDGNFSFKLKPQDTIKFSFVGYEDYFLSLDDSSQTQQIEISLTQSVKKLEEVRVHAMMNEQDFKNAIIAYKFPQEKKVEKMAGFYYGPPVKKDPKAFTSPISYLANKFSKREKQRKHFEKQKKIFNQQENRHTKYNKEIVANITGLNSGELDDFMHFCKLSDVLIDESSQYDINVAIKKCLENFKNNN